MVQVAGRGSMTADDNPPVFPSVEVVRVVRLHHVGYNGTLGYSVRGVGKDFCHVDTFK